MSWLTIHPKVKALAVAVAILVLGAVPTVLSNAVSFRDAAISVITATTALTIAYLKSS